MFYLVYKITNSLNNKIYIGVHKTKDINDDYMGSGTHLKRAQKKYGIENFKKEILQVFDNSEDMFNMESQLVNSEFVDRIDTYNLKEGGFGGFEYLNINNLNTKGKDYKLLSDMCVKAFQYKFETDVTFREIHLNNLKKASEKATLVNKQKWLNGGINGFKNKKHTDESKKRIGEANSVRQQGDGNSQFGTMWIHSLTEQVSKKIKKEDFPEYETQGWLKGRKMKFPNNE